MIKVLRCPKNKITEKYYTHNELENEQFIGLECRGERFLYIRYNVSLGGDVVGGQDVSFCFIKIKINALRHTGYTMYVFETAQELYKWMSEQ